MMYIRTKNGVYKIDEIKPYFLDEKQKLFINNELKVAINEQRVINQSKNLEELCDDFVLVNKVGNFDKSYVIHYDIPNRIFTEPTIEEKIESIKYIYKDMLDKIRGAIYTDKGLIYVAKMNGEGELELI